MILFSLLDGNSVKSVVYSPGGFSIVSGSEGAALCLWDAASGECLRVLEEKGRAIYSVAFSLDGRFIVSGNEDASVRICAEASGDCLHVLDGREGAVYSIAYSPNGRFVVINKKLRIHATLPYVHETLGPGARTVVWVQGCSHYCSYCMVPEAWDVNGGVVVEPSVLIAELLANPKIEGLTVSGGEPFLQVAGVTPLLEAFRESGKNTWVYTGYTIEELVERNDLETDRMLSLIDVLVDGRFEEKKAGIFRLRGSGNQRIIRLTEAIPLERINTGEASRVDVTLDGKGQLVVVGIPPPGFLHELRERLELRGVTVLRDFNI